MSSDLFQAAQRSEKSPGVVDQKPQLSADRGSVSEIGDLTVGQRLIQREPLSLQKPAERMAAEEMDWITPFDCGAVVNALVNAAWSRGLGAVINSQGIMQSPVVREHAGTADDQIIMKLIALGWPDETFPANAVVSERKPVKEATVFVVSGSERRTH